MTRDQKQFVVILCAAAYMIGMLADMFTFQLEDRGLATVNWRYKSGDDLLRWSYRQFQVSLIQLVLLCQIPFRFDAERIKACFL